ncbi:hypothetical protein HUJ05_007811 [Dendroctonus ponderosae]|nr:hypothetical protein HUJ05_007811 [Dendroctonus ponderosae]
MSGNAPIIMTPEVLQQLLAVMQALNANHNVQQPVHSANFAACKSHFDGSPGANVEAFVDSIKVYKECLNISDEHAVKGLSMLLTGCAATWWQGVKSSIFTFEEAVTALIHAYGYLKPPHQNLQATLCHGTSKTRALLSHLKGDSAISEHVQLDMIYGLLNVKIKERVSCEDVATFKELIEKSREAEQLLHSFKLLDPTTRCQPNTMPKPRQQCNFCKNYGHTREVCRKLASKQSHDRNQTLPKVEFPSNDIPSSLTPLPARTIHFLTSPEKKHLERIGIETEPSVFREVVKSRRVSFGTKLHFVDECEDVYKEQPACANCGGEHEVRECDRGTTGARYVFVRGNSRRRLHGMHERVCEFFHCNAGRGKQACKLCQRYAVEQGVDLVVVTEPPSRMANWHAFSMFSKGSCKCQERGSEQREKSGREQGVKLFRRTSIERLNAYRAERRIFKQLIKKKRRGWVEREIESVCEGKVKQTPIVDDNGQLLDGQDRDAFLVRKYHPKLSASERAVLEGLDKYWERKMDGCDKLGVVVFSEAVGPMMNNKASGADVSENGVLSTCLKVRKDCLATEELRWGSGHKLDASLWKDPGQNPK